MAEVDAPAPSRREVKQPPLSLTKAAAAVEVSTSTLRRAVEAGKLPASKTPEGHYRIELDELMQYKSNELDTPVDRGGEDVPTGRAAGVSTAAASGGASMGVDISVDVSHPAVQVLLLQQANEALKNRADDWRGRTRELEQERDDWKGQAQKLQEQASVATRLLTDERERYEQKELEVAASVQEARVKQSIPKTPLFVAVVLGAIAGASALLLYPDTARELLNAEEMPVVDAAMLEEVGQGVPMVDAAMLEVTPEVKPVVTAQPVVDTNPPR